MKSILMISFILFIVQSCTIDITPPNDLGNGEIVVNARNINLDQLPRTKVTVKLSRLNKETNELIYITNEVTDSKGTAIFKNLSYDDYILTPEEDNDIGFVVSSWGSVSEEKPNDTVKVSINYFWNFNEYEEDFEVDTNSLSQSWFSSFHNNGNRDTLICEFDFKNIPNWMKLDYTHTIYPPDPNNHNNSLIILSYKKNEIPIKQLPISIIIPIYHQYGTTNYTVTYNLKE